MSKLYYKDKLITNNLEYNKIGGGAGNIADGTRFANSTWSTLPYGYEDYVLAQTNWRFFFTQCENLSSIDISDWDTSRVTDMSWMFNGCISLTGRCDISKWDMSNNKSLNLTFANTSFSEFNLPTTGYGKLENCAGLFNNCTALTKVTGYENIVGNQTNSVNSVFGSCRSLSGTVDCSNWATNNVTNFSMVFYNCSNLTEINISGWNFSNSQGHYSLFENCSNLKTIYMDNIIKPDNGLTYGFLRNSSSLEKIYMRGCSSDTIEWIRGELTASLLNNVQVITA